MLVAGANEHQYLRHGIQPATVAKERLRVTPADEGLDMLLVSETGAGEDWSVRLAGAETDDAGETGWPVLWRTAGGPGL